MTIGEGRPVHVVEIDPRHPQAFDAWFAVMHVTDQERWPDGRSPFGLPKVKVIKIVVKKAKKK